MNAWRNATRSSMLGVAAALLLFLVTVLTTASAEAPPNIGVDEAIEAFRRDVLETLDISGSYIAFMHREPLRSGDELGPYGPDPMPPDVTGLPYVIPYDFEGVVWFFWIDRAPYARYAHPTQFVLIDAADGTFEVYDEAWWPVLNGQSLWIEPTEYWNRSHWASADLDWIGGDYGDAPEGQDTGYDGPKVVGAFPTLLDPGAPPGGYIVHRFPRDVVFLGDIAGGDTATDDPNGRVVDEDLDDGVLLARWIPCAEETLRFEVTVQPEADPEGELYFNVLVDWDRNGRWEGASTCDPTERFPDGIAPEWAIRNLRLDEAPYAIGPGFHGEIESPLFLTGRETEDVWIRATVSTQPIDEAVHVPVELGGAGWDGSGYFMHGETEDYGPEKAGPAAEPVPAPIPPPPTMPPAEPAIPPIGPSPTQCHLVVNGWAPGESLESDLRKDEVGMANVFGAFGPVTVLGPGNASPQALASTIANLAAHPCKELVLYIAGHGSPNTVWIGGQAVTATQLAAMLAGFGGDVYVLIDSCFSGSMIPALSGVSNVKKVKTACGSRELSYADWDPPFDPNPWDEGGEWTSGLREDLEELTDVERFHTVVREPAQEQGLAAKFVLLNEAYRSAVAKDAAAIGGLNTPQNWHEGEPLPSEELDFGDAPDPSYPTRMASNGASHVIWSYYYLGSCIDAEADGQPTPAADGDDLNGLDDEDGATVAGWLLPGTPAGLVVVASSVGFLDAWADFNEDGDWADAGEQIFASHPLAQGPNYLTFLVPPFAGSRTGHVCTRFRFSSYGGLSYVGAAADGEVEDYLFPIGEEWILDCVQELAEISADEAKTYGMFGAILGEFRRDHEGLFVQEMEIFKDSVYVTAAIRRCGRDLLNLYVEAGPAGKEQLGDLYWQFFTGE